VITEFATPAVLVDEYLQRGWWNQDTLWNRFADHARDRPDELAVVDGDLNAERCHTYGDLARHALSLAVWLRSQGLQTGDVASVQLPNVYEAVVVALALQQVGMVVNPILPNYRAKELTYIFAKAGTKVVFTPDSYRDFDHFQLIKDVENSLEKDLIHVVHGSSAEADYLLSELVNNFSASEVPDAEMDPMAMSEIIFSSGTEADPKAVVHTEQTTSFSVRNVEKWLGLTQNDVVYMPSPVGHSTGFNYGLRLAMHLGLKLVLQDKWDAKIAIELIDRHQCSYTLAATTFLRELTDTLAASEKTLPSLRLFGCGGAPVPSELVEAADDVGIKVQRLYGSTEVLAATWHEPDSSLSRRKASDGHPVANVDLELRDEDGKIVESGKPGEIFVRSPGTSVGYFEDPERTAATYLSDGWISTGDIGELDGSGDLRIVGRKKEIIIRGGLNIAPREVEDMLVAMPEVLQAAVVGIPDSRLGEKCCACVRLRPGESLQFSEMVERLSEAGLAKYKLPESLELFVELPMTSSGKIQKHQILQQLEERSQSDV